LTDEDLLRPTLSGFRRPPALFNSTGFFLCAFFGGPAGAGLYGLANSFRLGRIARDLPLIIGIVAASFLALVEMHDMGLLARLSGYLGGSVVRNMEIFLRALGIACFGAIYFLHRGFFRAARVSGTKALAGWIPGIVSVLAGVVANIAFTGWIQHH